MIPSEVCFGFQRVDADLLWTGEVRLFSQNNALFMMVLIYWFDCLKDSLSFIGPLFNGPFIMQTSAGLHFHTFLSCSVVLLWAIQLPFFISWNVLISILEKVMLDSLLPQKFVWQDFRVCLEKNWNTTCHALAGEGNSWRSIIVANNYLGVGVGVVGPLVGSSTACFPSNVRGIYIWSHWIFISPFSSPNIQMKILKEESFHLEVCDTKLELWGLSDLGLLLAAIYMGDDARTLCLRESFAWTP